MALFSSRKASSNGDDDKGSAHKPRAVPNHVAIIMDGNGRWARKKFLPHIEGHRAGAKVVRSIVEECAKIGVKYLTVYAFSSENWGRPEEEVSGLMRLFEQYLRSEVSDLKKNGVRLRAIGDLSRLSERVRSMIREAEEVTKASEGITLVLAISYGGRDEIVSAAKAFAEEVKKGAKSPDELTAENFRDYLYAPDIPDPDLLIRTSDEFRISNFLLWQLAYAEIVVTPVYWPDFSKDEFLRCIDVYSGRERRFGLTFAQLSARGA